MTASLAIITNLTHRKVLPSSQSYLAIILSQSPCQPGLPLTGFQFTLPRCCTGLPVLPRFPSSVHTDASTPAGTTRCSCRLSSQVVFGLPLITGGSAPTLPFSRPAQRSIQISACAVAELLNATLCHRSASNHVAPSIIRSGCYQPKRQLFGWASHPTRKTRLSTAHVESGAGALALGSGGLSVAFAPCLQFGSLDCVSSPPLIKPDVRISRIRLTDEITLARVIRAGVSDT